MTLWLKDVAPSTELRKWYDHDPERFKEFSRLYRAELAANDGAVERIEEFLKLGPVTLLFAAHDTALSHAQVLASYLAARAKRRSTSRAAPPQKKPAK